MVNRNGDKGATNPAPIGWKSLPNMYNNIYNQHDESYGVPINDHQFLVLEGHGSYLEYYDTSTEIWKRLSVDMPHFLRDWSVAFVGDRLLVMGGCDELSNLRSDVYAMHVPGGDLSAITLGQNWVPLARMREKRFGVACASDDRFVYIFGGKGNDSYECLATVEQYDTHTDRWTQLPDMPGGGRFGSAAGIVGNRIFVVGGQDNGVYADSVLRSTIVFDTSRQQWESPNDSETSVPIIPEMIIKRQNFRVLTVDRFLIVVGGDTDWNNKGTTIEVLDTEHHVWEIAPTPMPMITWNDSAYAFTAGVLKQSNKVSIIVAGMNGSTMAFTIPFETGILPPAFRLNDLFHFMRDHFANFSLKGNS